MIASTCSARSIPERRDPRNFYPFLQLLFFSLIALATTSLFLQARAESSPPVDSTYLPSDSSARLASREIKLHVSNGELIQLKGAAATMFVADPNVADIQIPARDKVFVFGKKPGRTTFFALREDGTKADVFSVVVTHNTADLSRFLRAEAGDLDVSLVEAPQGVILGGVVPSAEIAERVRAIAARLAGEGNPLINNLRVSGSLQVSIRVRVAEVSRSTIKDLGFNWDAIASAGAFTFGLSTGREFLTEAASGAGGGIIRSSPQGSAFAGFSGRRASITALIDALAAEGLVSILAEPTLTAISGEKASFLAGGEFPIPIVQGVNANAISIDYRKFGVALDFTPTVLSERLISLHVRPEVSDISAQGAVVLNGFQIPSITTRRTETTIQLGSGESLVIAGLVQSRFSTEIDKFPGMGDLPVLGPLFRSSRFRKNETELIIIVTPYVVRPIGNPADVALPTEAFAPPTDLERILQGRLARPSDQNPMKIKGDAGFTLR